MCISLLRRINFCLEFYSIRFISPCPSRPLHVQDFNFWCFWGEKKNRGAGGGFSPGWEGKKMRRRIRWGVDLRNLHTNIYTYTWDDFDRLFVGKPNPANWCTYRRVCALSTGIISPFARAVVVCNTMPCEPKTCRKQKSVRDETNFFFYQLTPAIWLLVFN